MIALLIIVVLVAGAVAVMAIAIAFDSADRWRAADLVAMDLLHKIACELQASETKHELTDAKRRLLRDTDAALKRRES